jgi:hypothetical protein
MGHHIVKLLESLKLKLPKQDARHKMRGPRWYYQNFGSCHNWNKGITLYKLNWKIVVDDLWYFLGYPRAKINQKSVDFKRTRDIFELYSIHWSQPYRYQPNSASYDSLFKASTMTMYYELRSVSSFISTVYLPFHINIHKRNKILLKSTSFFSKYKTISFTI